jgi:hypothetical protein
MTISGTDYTKIIALKTQELEMGRINRRRRRAKYYCDTGSDRLISLTDQIVSSSIYFIVSFYLHLPLSSIYGS